jgi:hypothetical protein
LHVCGSAPLVYENHSNQYRLLQVTCEQFCFCDGDKIQKAEEKTNRFQMMLYCLGEYEVMAKKLPKV